MDGTALKLGWQYERAAAVSAITPLIVLPAIACALIAFLPDWQAMWLLAVSIYCGLKWLTFVSCPSARRSSISRSMGYLILWPGMNAKSFLNSRTHAAKPSPREWLLAISKLSAGLVLLFIAVPKVLDRSAFVAGWIGMIGLILVLHFGFFHVLSLAWRLGGVEAEPLMDFPIKASSLSEFWGRRWNRAFRDVAFAHIFRPLVERMGVAWATMAVFIVSGLFHISSPLEGWNGPKPERHHDFIDMQDFPACWRRRTITVEVEAKAKELAVRRLQQDLVAAKTLDDTWFVYLLRCADGSLYTGITTNVVRRCEEHNAGTASHYTCSRRPVVLVYQERQGSRSLALKREAAIKALSKAEKESLIRLAV
jgi:predicted GIY-YIG superfamily endonuclease